MKSQVLASQLQKDRENSVIAKPTGGGKQTPLQIVRAKVKTVNPNGTYNCAVIGRDGATEVKVFAGVYGQYEQDAGDIVELKFTSPDTVEILAGGGGGCSFGILPGGIITD